MLGGQKIFGHGCSDRHREAAVADLNNGRVQGMVMSERVGGIGHNLIGASVMLFMGSLYSQAYEDQAIGMSAYKLRFRKDVCVERDRRKHPVQ